MTWPCDHCVLDPINPLRSDAAPDQHLPVLGGLGRVMHVRKIIDIA
jgi:hypothetical protein